MSIHGVLGEKIGYPDHYSPELLYPIERALGRANLPLSAQELSVGVDWWHAFEVSWLDVHGVSQVAMARFAIPADSACIIESKSLKLYLNGLNFTEFADWQAVQQTITQDLSQCVQAPVLVELFALDRTEDQADSLLLSQPRGECLEQVLAATLASLPDKIALTTDVQADFLSQGFDPNQPSLRQVFYCNLLRSNCPVTNQPDWGTVEIDLTAPLVDKLSLLKYLLSFRRHNGFHEQCVEQIFADLRQNFDPTALSVRAWYTRRGGLDINPCRVFGEIELPKPSRLIRQ